MLSQVGIAESISLHTHGNALSLSLISENINQE